MIKTDPNNAPPYLEIVQSEVFSSGPTTHGSVAINLRSRGFDVSLSQVARAVDFLLRQNVLESVDIFDGVLIQRKSGQSTPFLI